MRYTLTARLGVIACAAAAIFLLFLYPDAAFDVALVGILIETGLFLNKRRSIIGTLVVTVSYIKKRVRFRGRKETD